MFLVANSTPYVSCNLMLGYLACSLIPRLWTVLLALFPVLGVDVNFEINLTSWAVSTLERPSRRTRFCEPCRGPRSSTGSGGKAGPSCWQSWRSPVLQLWLANVSQGSLHLGACKVCLPVLPQRPVEGSLTLI